MTFYKSYIMTLNNNFEKQYICSFKISFPSRHKYFLIKIVILTVLRLICDLFFLKKLKDNMVLISLPSLFQMLNFPAFSHIPLVTKPSIFFWNILPFHLFQFTLFTSSLDNCHNLLNHYLAFSLSLFVDQ